MENLKKNSVQIDGIITVCWPQYGNKEETVDMTDIKSKFNGCYATNNSTICYVSDGVFVTPYTREAISAIRRAGLIEKMLYVPFSNGDYPKYEAARWYRLREMATESYYRDYEVDSIKWSNEHGIGELSPETMERCFRIPRNGVEVKHPYYLDTYYPICNEIGFDIMSVEKIGHYCTNNGRVVFVYRDGHTYVTRGYWIKRELEKAGYKESSLFVPFSNGEQITDSFLAREWERICSENK